MTTIRLPENMDGIIRADEAREWVREHGHQPPFCVIINERYYSPYVFGQGEKKRVWFDGESALARFLGSYTPRTTLPTSGAVPPYYNTGTFRGCQIRAQLLDIYENVSGHDIAPMACNAEYWAERLNLYP